jgi:hypothetical protein
MNGRLEMFLGKALFDFMFPPIVFFKLVFLFRFVVFTTLEFPRRPGRSPIYMSSERTWLPMDCLGAPYYRFAFI